MHADDVGPVRRAMREYAARAGPPRSMATMTVWRITYVSVDANEVGWAHDTLDRSRNYYCTRLLDHAVTRAHEPPVKRIMRWRLQSEQAAPVNVQQVRPNRPHTGRQWIAHYPYATHTPSSR
jgi:hypothetical protein